MGRGVTSAPESPGMEMLARLPVSPMRSRGVRGVALGSMSSCTIQHYRVCHQWLLIGPMRSRGVRRGAKFGIVLCRISGVGV
jgi:hypothetical protein